MLNNIYGVEGDEMFEIISNKSKRVLAPALTVATGALGLAACGGEKPVNWELGVSCPSDANNVRVVGLKQNHYDLSGSFAVQCTANGLTVAPNGIELVGGSDSVVKQKGVVSQTISVEADRNDVAECDAQISNIAIDHQKQAGIVSLDCVNSIQTVKVG